MRLQRTVTVQKPLEKVFRYRLSMVVLTRADPEKRAAMADVEMLLRGAIRARGNVYLMLNVSAAALPRVLDALPSMGSPTVTSLANGGHAVASVVPKLGVNRLIPALKAAGAHDILELPISKIVE